MASKTPQQRIRQFPNSGLFVEQRKLYCGFCHVIVEHKKKSTIESHLNSKSHLRKQDEGKIQRTLPTAVEQQIAVKNTWASMASTFASTGIPLYVFRNPKFRTWMRANLKNGECMPCETTLRKHLVNEGIDDLTETINLCQGKDVILMVDETQDIKNRKTVNMLISPAEPCAYFRLVNLEILEKCDGPAIIQFILRSLALVNVPITNVIALISDNAKYMISAGNTMALMTPRCIHSTCWAHVVHLVAEEIRASLELADQLISKVKACLVKAQSRREKLLEILELNGKARVLPPTPVITRWTTWLKTGNYHHVNFNEIKQWIKVSAADSKAMEKLKELIGSGDVEKELETVALVYPSLSSTIKTLEGNNLPSSDVFAIIETLRGILELSPELDAGLEKMNIYLNGKHPSIEFWRQVEFLDPRKSYKFGSVTELPHALKRFQTSSTTVPLVEFVKYRNLCHEFVPEDDFCPFKFWKIQSREMPMLSRLALSLLSIPATSAEVERSFSVLNKLFIPSRSSLNDENLNIHMRLKFNNRIGIFQSMEIDEHELISQHDSSQNNSNL